MGSENPKGPEKLIMLKKCRVKQHGEDLAEHVDAGKVVTVSGLDKVELLSRKLAEPYKSFPKSKSESKQ